jgi:hypothetical protein
MAAAATQSGEHFLAFGVVYQRESQDCGICCIASTLSALSSMVPALSSTKIPQSAYDYISSVRQSHDIVQFPISMPVILQKFPALLHGASTVELAEPLLSFSELTVSFSTKNQGVFVSFYGYRRFLY